MAIFSKNQVSAARQEQRIVRLRGKRPGENRGAIARPGGPIRLRVEHGSFSILVILEARTLYNNLAAAEWAAEQLLHGADSPN